MCQYQQCGLVVANAVGKIIWPILYPAILLITHNMTRNNSDMVIRNYHHMGHSSYKYRAIEILLYELLYEISYLEQYLKATNRTRPRDCLWAL